MRIGDETAERERTKGKVPVSARRLPRWRLPPGARGVFTRRSVQAGLSVAVVLLLLISDFPSYRGDQANSRVSTASTEAPSSANATDYLPYLLNSAAFPLPSPLLNSTGGASMPQLAQAALGQSSAFQLAFVQTSFGGTNNLSFASGSYNASLAIESYTQSGCGGPCPRIPIEWTVPVVVAEFGKANVSADAIAANGNIVAVAAAFGTSAKTTVWLSYGSGAEGTWTNLTAPHGLLPGGAPRLALIPCGLIVTTIGSTALYATTFPFACSFSPNSPSGSPGGGTRSPSPQVPTVTAVLPNYGSVTSVVNVSGTNFAAGATTSFGGAAALSTMVLSPNLIQAVAPSGSGVVHVTVTSGGYTSNGTCSDLFAYGNYSGSPTISSISPSSGPPGQLVTISGSGFTNGGLSGVDFGGIASPEIVRITSSQVQVIAPAGNGTVYVTATVGGKTSLANCGAEFTYNPGAATPNTASFPAAVAAYPAWITGGSRPVVGVLASNTSNSQVLFYNSTDDGRTFRSSEVEPFNNSLGSPVFTRLGQTRTVVAAGEGGQVAFSAEGAQLFGLFTSRVQGRAAIETVASTDAGRTWSGPYLTASYAGSVLDPEAATSPAGYAYATWRENAAGPWQIDSVVYSFDAKALVLPTTIPGSAGGASDPAGPPSIAVDAFQRPLYVWSLWNSTAGSFELRETGGFLSPQSATQTLRTAWNFTSPSDFVPMSAASLGFFKSNVNGTIVALQSALSSVSSHKLCWSWVNFTRGVYPNVTTQDPSPIQPAPGSVVSGCSSSPTPGVDASKTTPIEGPFAADTYLYVYSDWISEALGYGTLPSVNWAGSPVVGNVSVVVSPPSGASGSPYLHASANTSEDSQGDVAIVAPQTINPNTLWLNASDRFASRTASGLYKQLLTGGSWKACGGWNYSDNVVSVSLSLVVVTSSGHRLAGNFTNPFEIPGIWVTNLSAEENGSWWENASLTFREWYYSTNTCTNTSSSHQVSPIDQLWPTDSTLRLNGSFTTGLSFDPWTPSLPLTVQTFPDPNNGSLADDSVHWNNTIWANASAWNNESYCGPGCAPYTNWSGDLSTWQTPENLAFAPQPNNNQYFQVTATIQSHRGGYPSGVPGSQTLNAGEMIGASNPLLGIASCAYYQTVNPIHIGLPASPVTNVTDTSATVTWFSDTNGSGWLDYNDTWEALFSATATETASGNASYPYAYVVELRGLRSWGVYEATLGVGAYSGCLEYLNDTHIVFQTLTQAAPFEYDNPYDSITQQGGGAVIEWQEPAGFQAIANYTDGSLSFWPTANTSDVVSIPLPSIWFVEDEGALGTTMGVNLTGLTTDSVYGVSLNLNYTVRPPSGKGAWLPLWVGSKPYTFWYEKDTSGDGLTDWEKLRGWEVTAQHADGSWYSGWVTANPSLYATNGLTSDYEEKLYRLNPATVDTASSHMLDVWNLTFSLGPKSQPLKVPSGANFRYWSEAGNSSTDYRWTTACQYYPGPGASCAKSTIGVGWSNLTGNDSWAWASRVLWSRAALTSFINMSGVRNASWLRATLGNTSTNWTLTVWGKLSWAANPLAASTPLDGIPDGARINPLYDEDLLISSLSSSLSVCPSPGGGSYGWAPLFYLNWSTSAGPSELPATGNYSRQAWDNGTTSCGSISNYQVPIPINGTSQNQSLQVRLVMNEGSTLKAAKINGAATKISVIYDSEWGKARSYSYSGSGSSGLVGSLSFTLSMVPSGVKDNTLLWLPTDNGTLDNLPWGLKRYTGEQAFDLIVVNQTNSSAITSDRIPYAQNGSDHYQITLNPGLNNILIPRTQFLYSALGQAILLGRNASWINASASAPLLGSDENSSISGYGPMTNPLVDLACYWQNRAINNTTGDLNPICNGTGGFNSEAGTQSGSSKGIVVVVATAASGANIGGVPGDASLESAGEAGAALQTVIQLNISVHTGLDLLLAALLDNVTGGVNGTFVPVTSQVSSLGLSSVVTQALANATYTSGGLFGVPVSIVPPPPPAPPCNAFWCWAPNLVSGIVEVGSTFFSYVWSTAVSIAQYVNDHIPTWLKNFGAEVASRTAAGLVALGQDLQAALVLFVQALQALLQTLLSPVIDPIKTALTNEMVTVSAAANQTESDVIHLGSVTAADAMAFAKSIDPLAVATVAITLVIAVGLTILAGVSFGENLLMGVLSTLFFTLLFLAPVALITELSSNAVLWLESHYPNGLPASDWAAVAGTVGIMGGSGDFFMWLVKGATSAANIPGTAYATMAVTMAMDLVVIMMSVLSWAAANAVLSALALVIAVLAVALVLLGQKSLAGALTPYARISALLAGAGSATAAANLAFG